MRRFLMAVLVFIIMLLVFGLVAIGYPLVKAQTQKQKPVTNTVTTFWWDRDKEIWVKNIVATPVATDAYGAPAKRGSRTIIIMVDPNNPIRDILIDEAVVIRDDRTSPLLEINGHDDSSGSSGKIHIGTLTFSEVEAEEMEVNADVVRHSSDTVAAKDDELHLTLNAVNVVRTGRGGSSVFSLGQEGRDTEVAFEAGTFIGTVSRSIMKGGLRVDRIRILGPSSGTGFIERIAVVRTSVFGKIDVRNVAIQDLIMERVSLDDGL